MDKAKSAVPPPQRIRDKSGRFIKGQTGCANSPGRPKLREEFKQFAREKSFEALQVVYRIMTDAETNQRDRTAAARLLMEYGYGRPAAEYDRERFDLEKARFEAERKEASGDRVIQVILSDDARELAE